MQLDIFHDGQFFIGIVSSWENGKVKYVKYLFGQEPNDQEVAEFINNELLVLLESTQTTVKSKKNDKRINPKRLQRKVAKEQKESKKSTYAQEAIKQELELKKKEKKKRNKQMKEEQKAYKRTVKRNKAKEKHKGH